MGRLPACLSALPIVSSAFCLGFKVRLLPEVPGKPDNAPARCQGDAGRQCHVTAAPDIRQTPVSMPFQRAIAVDAKAASLAIWGKAAQSVRAGTPALPKLPGPIWQNVP
jgi:hypothetical protein